MPFRPVAKPQRSPWYEPPVLSAVFTVGALVSTVITVGVQLVSGRNVNLAQSVGIYWFLSNDAAGASDATAASGGVASGATGHGLSTITGRQGLVVSNASGHFDLAITDSATRNMYLVLVMPDGTLEVSPVLAF